MTEKFESGKLFVKGNENSQMLKESLESGQIDQDLIPFLQKFFLLPITPRESCYGHVERDEQGKIERVKEPYLGYVEDDIQAEQGKRIQNLFKERLAELNSKINERIGNKIVRIDLEAENFGEMGPKAYTLRFIILDKKLFKEKDHELLNAIWEEFSRYIDKLQ